MDVGCAFNLADVKLSYTLAHTHLTHTPHTHTSHIHLTRGCKSRKATYACKITHTISALMRRYSLAVSLPCSYFHLIF